VITEHDCAEYKLVPGLVHMATMIRRIRLESKSHIKMARRGNGRDVACALMG